MLTENHNMKTKTQEFNESGVLIRQEYWLCRKKRHKDHGPALIRWDDEGNLIHEEYWANNKLHNDNGPAVILFWALAGTPRYEEYWVNGKLHNEHGPAMAGWNDHGRFIKLYYLNGEELDKEEWKNRINSCNGKIVEIDGKKYKLEEIT